MTAIDFIKRFTPTPFVATFALSGASVRVETNCQQLVDRLRNMFPPLVANGSDQPSFVWRVVAESDNDDEPEDESSSVHRLTYAGLSFITLGQKNFLACDWQARLGICFVSQDLVTDEKLFRQCFLPAIISLLKESAEKESIETHR